MRDGKARSRDERVVAAPRREIDALQRAELDAAFATLADDPDHRSETRPLDAEFAGASWEALQRAEEIYWTPVPMA